MWKTLKQFYDSKEWENFRNIIIAERTNICEECGKEIYEAGDIIIHHIKELTLDNVNDIYISLNPENVMVVCFDCHNKVHERFGYGNKRKYERGIYLVSGAPCSGKTTYVKEHMTKGDLVIDLDEIFRAISLQDKYDKPDNLKYNVFAIKNLLIDNIKTRYGNFHSAWVIGGYSNKYEREKLSRDLGAEIIIIETTKEECIARLKQSNDYRKVKYKEWEGYINKWFDEFL
ncbi:MAG: AAA family ATPase [Paraclostridium sp.]